jgi:calcineurin-like phosphoesterase family protein
VGNHDRTATSLRRCGYDAAKVFKLETPDGPLVMRHRPQDFISEEITTAYALLHGHMHGQAHYGDRPPSEVAKMMDCGVDATRSIVPLSLDEILALYRERKNG